jgi:hypothetical protein
LKHEHPRDAPSHSRRLEIASNTRRQCPAVFFSFAGSNVSTEALFMPIERILIVEDDKTFATEIANFLR